MTHLLVLNAKIVNIYTIINVTLNAAFSPVINTLQMEHQVENLKLIINLLIFYYVSSLYNLYF